jgi:hypothetical protein
MDWKNALYVTLLIIGTVLAAVGCSKADVVDIAQTPNVSQATTQTAPSGNLQPQSTGPSVNGTKPQPKPGISGNVSMPLPPSGNVTGERPASQTMDMAAAAAKLGVTEQQLTDALGNTQQGMPDFSAAAQKLGCTETALREALGFSNNGTMPQGPMPTGTPPAGANQSVK